jgi:hypothetical protein
MPRHATIDAWCRGGVAAGGSGGAMCVQAWVAEHAECGLAGHVCALVIVVP